MDFNSFPKLWALGQKHIQSIFESEVEITEKVDGSQFSFGTIDGKVVCRSKGKIINMDAPEKMFQKGVEYVRSIANILPDNVQFWGEYLNKPKHNTLCYDRTPKNNIALFGMMKDGEFISDYETLTKYAENLEVDVVPLIYKGTITPEEVLSLIKRKSFLGSIEVEGVVVKNYNKDYFLGGEYFPIMCGKYVSEKFKEVHGKNWKKENTGKGKWGTFCEQYKTPARWDKAVQHLKEKGELTESPKDIGNLIKEIQQDIKEEEKENIKEALWNIFGKELLRESTKGLPEWYKEQLLKGEI